MNMMSTASRQQRALQAKDAMRELSGEIRNVVSEPLACTASAGGTMRYNPATGKVEYCDGLVAVWMPLSSGVFGGIYTLNQTGVAVGNCDHINPMTGGYSCPPGFTDTQHVLCLGSLSESSVLHPHVLAVVSIV